MIIDGEFEKVAAMYYTELFRFAMSLAKNRDAAWDLTQQTFAIYAVKRASIRNPDSQKQWLFTTLFREFLQSMKFSSRNVSLEESPAAMAGGHTEPENSLHMDAQAVVECLSRLMEPHRTILTLFYFDQKSYKEIATELDIPIGTVMSRMSRGKEELRRMMGSTDLTAPAN